MNNLSLDWGGGIALSSSLDWGGGIALGSSLDWGGGIALSDLFHSLQGSNWLFELIICFFLLVGGVFCLGGSIGLLRFPDIYCKMQALSKPVTLGIFNLIIAYILFLLYAGQGLSMKGILAVVFLLLTIPIGSHMIIKASYRSGIPIWTESLMDQLADTLPDGEDNLAAQIRAEVQDEALYKDILDAYDTYGGPDGYGAYVRPGGYGISEEQYASGRLGGAGEQGWAGGQGWVGERGGEPGSGSNAVSDITATLTEKFAAAAQEDAKADRILTDIADDVLDNYTRDWIADPLSPLNPPFSPAKAKRLRAKKAPKKTLVNASQNALSQDRGKTYKKTTVKKP